MFEKDLEEECEEDLEEDLEEEDIRNLQETIANFETVLHGIYEQGYYYDDYGYYYDNAAEVLQMLENLYEREDKFIRSRVKAICRDIEDFEQRGISSNEKKEIEESVKTFYGISV